ncbi:MAG: hypothetical protein KIT83_02730 [Bryobacterales bacterium]|nr:hypothetical protein [Bryobacterales bacterium]
MRPNPRISTTRGKQFARAVSSRTRLWRGMLAGFLLLAGAAGYGFGQTSHPDGPLEDPRYVVRTIAGSLTPGYGGDGGPADMAALDWPRGVETDRLGNVYIADSENCRIRKIDVEGTITTVAGNGICGAGPEGVSALESSLNRPIDVAVNLLGEVIFTEASRIRKVDSLGVIRSVAGVPPIQQSNCNPQDGAAALSACLRPSYLDLAPDGSIYFSDSFLPDRVRKVDSLGVVTTVAGSFGIGFSGDGGPALSALLNSPQGVLYHEGNLYIADEQNFRIRRVDPLGIIRTIAGNGILGGLPDGLPALTASISPRELRFDELNNRLLFTNTSTSAILALDADDRIQVVIGPIDTDVLPDILAENTVDRETRLRAVRGLSIDAESGDILYSEGNPGSGSNPTSTSAARIRRGFLGATACQIPFPGDSTGVVGTLFRKSIPYQSDGVESFEVLGLPPGLTATGSRIDLEITIEGIPTVAGEFDVTVLLNCGGRTTFKIIISAGACLFITESPLPNGRSGVPYSQSILYQAAGAQSISLAAGALPPGLELAPPPHDSTDATWRLQGIPLNPGTYSFTLRLTPCGQEKQFVIVIDESACLFVTQSPLPSGQIRLPYTTSILYTAVGAQTISLVEGTLPPGILLVPPPGGTESSTWRLAGTPTQAGEFLFTLGLHACGARMQYRLTIAPETLLISTPSLPEATVGCLYSFSLTAAGGTPPYQFLVSSGILPAGLTLNATGLLTGTPTLAGSSNLGFEVVDSNALRAPKLLTLIVASALTWVTTSVPQGTVGEPYAGVQLQVSGGSGPASFTALDPLPAGLTLSPTGQLGGTAQAAFNGSIRLRANASGNCSADTTLPLVIRPAGPTEISLGATVPNVELRSEYETSVTTNNPPSSAIAGNLQIRFASLAEEGRDNPEVSFATDPRSRNAGFTVNSGQTTGLFTTGETIRFNSGTVAGTIILTAMMDTGSQTLIDTLEYAVPPGPPRLLGMSLTRSGNTVTVTATGYAPRRRITTGTLDLVPRAGVAISGNTSIPLSQLLEAFTTYFAQDASREFGSQFVLTIPLTISGGTAADLAEVRLTLVGETGENSNVLTAQ